MDLMQERTTRYIKALKLEQPDRVPHETRFGEYWALDYAGYDIRTDTSDAQKMLKTIEKLAQDFATDTCPSLFTRNPLFYKLLGSKSFTQSESGIMQHPEVSCMSDEEYPELIKDPFKFIVDKVLPRVYTSLSKDKAPSTLTFAEAMNIKNDMNAPVLMGTGKISQQYQLPLTGMGLVEAPMDFIADMIRGFEKMALDFRRRRDLVKEAADSVLPLMIRFATQLPPMEGKTISIPLHMPVFMRTKDFEELYYPSFKALIEALSSKGYYLKIYFEGDWTRYYDYLQDLPKGHIIGCMEYMDAKYAKQKLGKTMCLSCGYDVSLLQYATKEKVIDTAKALIDDLAPGGGFIFSVSKGITYPGDGKAENVKALYEFVEDYGKY